MHKKTNRREFIKKLGAASTAVTISSLGFPSLALSKPKKTLGIALVGLGYYSGSVLAPALQLTKNCKLTGIVTGSPDKIPKWQKQYGIADKNVYNYGNMSQIADNPDIDVIYIVLPTGLHAKYSVLAAETGKHIWCEKPMARTVTECQQIIDACKKNKVKLSIGYRMQHEPNTQELIRFGQEKTYGKILKIKAEAGYYDGRTNHWKQNKVLGGGAMYDMGVYPLNAVRYATGEEPIAVTARHETTRPEVYHEVDETTYFDLEFPSGAIANCQTSLGKSMNILHVDCAKGWYELSPFQAYNGVKGRTSDGKVLSQYIENQQARQMDDDALAIINDKKVMVPGIEGLLDIKVVEAIYRSAKLGKRVKI